MVSTRRKAFTLVELLVVISTIGLLMAISVPALVTARSGAQSAVCRSNLRQLVLANMGYSNEHDGFCVPAASDIWSGAGGFHRWHGVRDNRDEAFDPRSGPLTGYLAGGKVKECPGKVKFTKGKKWKDSFEKGCGGYGYNMTYVGSCLWRRVPSLEERYGRTTRISAISKPYDTLMFTDTGFNQGGKLIEYSFAEPYFWVYDGQVMSSHPLPSIHFRHRGCVNIGWSDGHCGQRKKADYEGASGYNKGFDRINLGWFEPLDNTLFDLQ
ncbi:MAG: type II secretion system protein [Planctomycetota bacterium]|jgi:prepilin-type N-terminal cleavage/methylation domain-containing protein